MGKIFWERIQRSYPKALEECVRYFKQYGDGWRANIKDPDKLIKYFERRDIKLILTKSGTKYGFQMTTPHMTVKVFKKWSERPNAIWWGIDYCFKALEQRYIGNIYNSTFTKPVPARNKEEHSGPNWGDNVIGGNK